MLREARSGESAPQAADAARPAPPAHRLHELQRSVGNRAVGRLLARRPAYKPKPSWAKKGPKQSDRACLVLSETEANFKWDFWAERFEKEAVSRCGCDEVGPVWHAYFQATGQPRFVWKETEKPSSCVITSMSTDEKAHNDPKNPHEDRIIESVHERMPSLVARMRGKSSITIPLREAGVPAPLLSPRVVFNDNTRVGGQLFGGLSAPDASGNRPDDSEYGPDTRTVDGTVRITRSPDPFNADRVLVATRFRLDYRMTDAVDFCPGNTGENAHWMVRESLLPISCLEASGMARDIYVEAQYFRAKEQGPWGPYTNPDPKLVVVPVKALFGFDSAELSQASKDTILAGLGDRPTRADTSKPIRVRGHTDSKGDPGYNQGLSERRAAAVARLLEEHYPNLAGHIEPVGLGETEPIAPNTTPDGRDNPAGRALNRRVELEMDEQVQRL